MNEQVAGEIDPDEEEWPETPTSVNLRKEDLPLPLQDRAEDLDRALNKRPPPMDLGQGVGYQKATDVRRVAEVLIEELHTHLEDVDAIYWFRSSLSGYHAKTSTPSGRWRSHTGTQFYVDVDLSDWVEMNAAERIRLVDHELCHVDWDMENDKAAIGHHEIEEYSSILRRWGPTDSQERFVETAAQLDLSLPEE